MKRGLILSIAVVLILSAMPQVPLAASTRCSVEQIIFASGAIPSGFTETYTLEAGQSVLLHVERSDNQGGLEGDYYWYEEGFGETFDSDQPSADWYFIAPGTGTYDHVLFPVGAAAPGMKISYVVRSGDCRLMFVDGRLNNFDMAAPVAVYPQAFANGVGMRFYAINSAGEGTLTLEVTPEMIAAVPDQPAENTLIASTPDGSIALYRLTTGEFQVNAGEYVITFSDLYAGASYYTP
ncbi:MAG: hypothetical protein JXN59_17205 [Anaerolineae bacterium]|nr:hypothetical protein [Anaerolineae bacterium]